MSLTAWFGKVYTAYDVLFAAGCPSDEVIERMAEKIRLPADDNEFPERSFETAKQLVVSTLLAREFKFDPRDVMDGRF
jgi:hypothetical protein